MDKRTSLLVYADFSASDWLSVKCSISAESSEAFSEHTHLIHYNINIALFWPANAGFFV